MDTSPTPASDAAVYSSEERMSVDLGDRIFTCIEYPGIVENVENALETLGGIKSVAKSVKDDKKKLDLHFRPGDVYCKPAIGTSQNTTGLLMRVRRRKRLPASTTPADLLGASSSHGDEAEGEDDGYEYQVQVIGAVTTTIKFTGMCDFQYLPVSRNEDGTGYESLLPTLVLKRLIPQSEYMARDAPRFLPPVTFSRLSFPHGYGFLKNKFTANMTAVDMHPTGSVVVGRKKRKRFTVLVSFTDPTPTQPREEARSIAEKFRQLKTAVEELFEERPIWPRTALLYRLRHDPNSCRCLKFILPSLAYVFLTGPWRTFWIKIGYDPRKDPAAKKFQGIDFRRRQKGVGENLKIQSKRGVMKRKDPHPKKVSEINLSLLRDDGEESDSKEPKLRDYEFHPDVLPPHRQPKLRDYEFHPDVLPPHRQPKLRDYEFHPDVLPPHRQPKLRDYEFHPDVLPPHRQVSYMICDIFDPEVQALASRNDGKEKKCDERDGWCVTNFTDMCRSIMVDHVDKLCPDIAIASQCVKKYQGKKQKLRLALNDTEGEDADSSLDAR